MNYIKKMTNKNQPVEQSDVEVVPSAHEQPANADNTTANTLDSVDDLSALDAIIQALPDTTEPEESKASTQPETNKAQELNETSEEEEEEEKEATKENEDKLPERVRLINFDEIEKKAILLRRDNPHLSLKEALDIVTPKAKEPEAKDDSENSEPESIDSLVSQIKDLKEQRKAALKAYDLEVVPDIEEKMELLEQKLYEAQEEARQRAKEEDNAWQKTITESKQRMAEVYPDAAVKGSELQRKMIELDKIFTEQDNPICYDPNKYFKIAQIAANALNIAPRSYKSSTQTNAKPVAQPTKTGTSTPSSRGSAPRAFPMSGNARTNSNNIGDFDAALDALDEDSFLALASKL